MARHERDTKLKRITRIFTYFILILVIILLFFFLRRWENNQHEKVKESTAYCTQAASPVFEKS